MAYERVDALGAGDVRLNLLLHALFAVSPFDVQALLFEQALVIGDQLRQALERRGAFQNELLHASLPVELRGLVRRHFAVTRRVQEGLR